MEVDRISAVVKELLKEMKVKDVVHILLDGRKSIADEMFVATCTSTRHVFGVADKMAKKLKEHDIPSFVEGTHGDGDWILVDLGYVLIHLFTPEKREMYKIEELWKQTPPQY